MERSSTFSKAAKPLSGGENPECINLQKDLGATILDFSMRAFCVISSLKLFLSTGLSGKKENPSFPEPDQAHLPSVIEMDFLLNLSLC
jgi:hypothetical protein